LLRNNRRGQTDRWPDPRTKEDCQRPMTGRLPPSLRTQDRRRARYNGGNPFWRHAGMHTKEARQTTELRPEKVYFPRIGFEKCRRQIQGVIDQNNDNCPRYAFAAHRLSPICLYSESITSCKAIILLKPLEKKMAKRYGLQTCMKGSRTASYGQDRNGKCG
jgi:hypothetical protein